MLVGCLAPGYRWVVRTQPRERIQASSVLWNRSANGAATTSQAANIRAVSVLSPYT